MSGLREVFDGLTFHPIDSKPHEAITVELVLAKVSSSTGERWVWEAPGRSAIDPRILLFEVDAVRKSIEAALVAGWSLLEDEG